MSSATHIFLPWVQPGLASPTSPTRRYVERFADATNPRQSRYRSASSSTASALKILRLYGPGDVTGIDPQQIVRLEPKPAPPTSSPTISRFVEFDRPDFPWLFSPAKADAQGRLRPWLCLVVRRQQRRGAPARRRTPLPVLEIKPPARPRDELPDLAESASLGARADHRGGENGASTRSSNPNRRGTIPV